MVIVLNCKVGTWPAVSVLGNPSTRMSALKACAFLPLLGPSPDRVLGSTQWLSWSGYGSNEYGTFYPELRIPDRANTYRWMSEGKQGDDFCGVPASLASEATISIWNLFLRLPCLSFHKTNCNCRVCSQALTGIVNVMRCEDENCLGL